MLTSTRDWRRRENNPRIPYKGLFGLWHHSLCQSLVLGQSLFNQDPQNVLHPSALQQCSRSHICCTLAPLIMTCTQTNTYLARASTRGLSVARPTCWHSDRLVKSSPLLRCVWLAHISCSPPTTLQCPSWTLCALLRGDDKKKEILQKKQKPHYFSFSMALPPSLVCVVVRCWVCICVCSMVISPELVGLWVLACGFSPSGDRV